MRIYSCVPEWEAMLTCIYEASSSGLGFKNIRLMLEPIEQYTLFDEYIHVDADHDIAVSVMEAVKNKISYHVYQELAFTSMAYEEDVLDNIYHVMILGFNYGKDVLQMVQFRDIIRNREIRSRVMSEANRFQEIIRFHQIGDAYVAHIEPKSRVVTFLGTVFEDRMPSENFMIVDDVHREAVVHKRNEHFYNYRPSDEEFERLLVTEGENDEYTDLWRVFFNTIAIKERKNEACQNNHFPKWARAHAVEFM